jgi:hypothetical protein
MVQLCPKLSWSQHFHHRSSHVQDYGLPKFCTHLSGEHAADLAAYLEWVHDGAIVVGITGDEPTRSLSPAQRALRVAGVSVGDVQHRGNFAFIIQKGFQQKTRMVKSLTNIGAHAAVKVAIIGSTSDDLQFVDI